MFVYITPRWVSGDSGLRHHAETVATLLCVCAHHAVQQVTGHGKGSYYLYITLYREVLVNLGHAASVGIKQPALWLGEGSNCLVGRVIKCSVCSCAV